jgi:hypothetical protein
LEITLNPECRRKHHHAPQGGREFGWFRGPRGDDVLLAVKRGQISAAAGSQAARTHDVLRDSQLM